ncbi:MAG: cyanophycin synthetase [Lentisphaeria bacterium]
MRDLNPALEKQFFDIFSDYYDSEKIVLQKHNSVDYNLTRLYPLADLVDWPDKKVKIIHVAGTKGKGSTCFFISALLNSAGFSTGIFTSPHLSTVRERFQINNQLLPYELLIATGKEFVGKLKKTNLHPSLFEIFTVMALDLFCQQKLDYVVLETGLGGRLDATNYIKTPLCTAITPISFDHTAILGNTIEAIAKEKAGILKPHCPVVISKQPFQKATEVIVKQAHKFQCPIFYPVDQKEIEKFHLHHLPNFLLENFCSALRVMDILKIHPKETAFKQPVLRARCEEISHDPLIILDAAHNADSAQKMAQAIASLYPNTFFTVILGVLHGKDIKGIVQACLAMNAEFILTNPHTTRVSALEELQKEAEKAHLNIRKVIPSIQSIKDIPPYKNLLFTGSFFTALIGEQLFETGTTQNAESNSPKTN